MFGESVVRRTPETSTVGAPCCPPLHVALHEHLAAEGEPGILEPATYLRGVTGTDLPWIESEGMIDPSTLAERAASHFELRRENHMPGEANRTRYIHARRALIPEGWARDARAGIEQGHITSLETDVAPAPEDIRTSLLLPGLPNLHSHAFQRAMAGLTEYRGPTNDSFWTWRETMYRFALVMTPEHVEAIAALAYMEMLEKGFTRVGEFHYVHHDIDGGPYDDVAEMASRIAAAAARTGIALTLLPVFYAHADFGGVDANPGQRRFVTDLDTYSRLLQESERALRDLESPVVGVAPHSLRAATLEEIREVSTMRPNAPVHIHVAEQQREVAGCISWSGKRPVGLLLDELGIDERWCLIHATHMNPTEVDRLAASGAVAGLCPITEANLGDGVFPGGDFIASGGRYGVGTDSNVAIDAAGELRQLEYSQRLRHRERNVMATSTSTGRSLFDTALLGGSTALGAGRSGLAIGAPADLVALTSDVMDITDGDAAVNGWVFTNQVTVSDVWVAGHHVVREGKHVRRDEIARDYRSTIHHVRQAADLQR